MNYKSAASIARLKASLQQFPPAGEWEWLVVDNFSSVAEGARLEAILADMPNAHLIPLAQNIGYGAGNWEGVRFAAGELLAIINPDIEVLEGSFERLMAGLLVPKTAEISARAGDATSLGIPGICVPVLQSAAGTILKNTRRFPSPWKIMRRRIFGYSPAIAPTQARSVEWAQGSFWVLKKSLFEELGGFDERFFLFFEDTDFCRRVRARGLEIVQVPEARAIHSPNRLSGGNVFLALFRRTFWIHIVSAGKYFWKWREGE